jgi:hypothetical protein
VKINLAVIRTTIIFFSIVCSFSISNAQYYNYGQEPTNIKWQIIETEHYNVIYPKGNENQGQRVAFLLNSAYPLVGKSLNHNHKKWNVILHTQSATGLAYVAPTPSRSEWFTMQDQSPVCMDWLNLLVAHETRHMVQQSKIDMEMPRFIRYLLGEQATPVIIGAYLPFWFMEGDATSNETALGPTGSGRMPQFQIKNRAQLVEKEPFSFNKSCLGSYKNYTTDAYEMGYLMVGGSRHLYQKLIWDSVVTRVAKKPFSFTPFNKGIKQSTGISKYQLFDTIYAHYQQLWKEEIKNISPTPFKTISSPNKYDANYMFGTKLSDNKYFAYKTSLTDLSCIVVINPTDKEEKVFTLDNFYWEDISAKDSMVVWVENAPNARWVFADKTIIRMLNLNTGKRTTFRDNKRYQAPCLSPDNSKILVVEVDEVHTNHIRILDAQTGEVIWSFETPENDFFKSPSWSQDGQEIVAILLKDNKQALVKTDIQTKAITTILPFENQYISCPVQKGDYVYYVGGYTGVDNVYSVHTPTGELRQETNVLFGVRDISIQQNELICSNYRSGGYELVSISLDSLLHKNVDINNLHAYNSIADNLVKQEGGVINFDSIQTSYESKKYSKLKNVFNFHSWGPFSFSASEMMAYPGVSIMSQNLLSTTEFIAGYKYNTQEGHGAVFANLKYKGLYPVIESNFEYGKRSSLYAKVIDDWYTDGNDWEQITFDFKTYVPLNLSNGKYNNYLEPSIGYQLVNRMNISLPSNYLSEGNTHLTMAGLYMHSKMKQSRQDIIPNFSISFDLKYYKALKGVGIQNYMTSVENNLSLPGLFKSHGIKFYNAYQYKQQVSYLFDDQIRMTRGYKPFINNELYTFEVDYVFPIAYPDYTLWNALYFKRFKAALFYDHSWVSGKIDYTQPNELNYQFKSTGIELTSDLHFFQISAPFEIGVRVNYLQNNSISCDLIFGASAFF